MKKCIDFVKDFKKKYPLTVAFRMRRHANIIDKHLNPGESILYAFCAQKNESPLTIINTCAVVLTDRRIIIGMKRILFGYFFISVTPEKFNDLTVHSGIIWGSVHIDTLKEQIFLSNIDKHALSEIETLFTDYMFNLKHNNLRSSVESLVNGDATGNTSSTIVQGVPGNYVQTPVDNSVPNDVSNNNVQNVMPNNVPNNSNIESVMSNNTAGNVNNNGVNPGVSNNIVNNNSNGGQNNN